MPLRSITKDPFILGAKRTTATEVRRMIKLKVSKKIIEKYKKERKEWLDYLIKTRSIKTAKPSREITQGTVGIFNEKSARKSKGRTGWSQ